MYLTVSGRRKKGLLRCVSFDSWSITEHPPLFCTVTVTQFPPESHIITLLSLFLFFSSYQITLVPKYLHFYIKITDIINLLYLCQITRNNAQLYFVQNQVEADDTRSKFQKKQLAFTAAFGFAVIFVKFKSVSAEWWTHCVLFSCYYFTAAATTKSFWFSFYCVRESSSSSSNCTDSVQSTFHRKWCNGKFFSASTD